jgi:hypothetical protein
MSHSPRSLCLAFLLAACGDSGAGTATASTTASTTAGSTTATSTGAETTATPTTGTATGDAPTGTGTGAASSGSTATSDAPTTAVEPTTGGATTGDATTGMIGTSGTTGMISTTGTSSTSGTTGTSSDDTTGAPGTSTGDGSSSTGGAVMPPPEPEMLKGCASCECCDPWPISWGAVEGATEYVVRWKCSINPEQVKMVGNVTKIADVCNDIDMCNGMCAFTVGYVRVQACNDEGCSAAVDLPGIPITCGGGCCC